MWIKRSLVIIPILLFAFLAQSIFWVPSTGTAADNEGRQNRIVIAQGGDPRDMNPWTATATTDSNIYSMMFEGLLYYDRVFNIAPYLSEYAAIHHRVTAPVAPGMNFEEFRQHLSRKYGEVLAECKEVSAPADATSYFDLVRGERAPGPGPNVAAFRAPGMVEVLLRAPIRMDELTSAVDPDFCKDLYGAAMEKFLAPSEGADPGLVTPEAAKKVATVAGLPSLTHKPIVEMRVRQGVYWTDGPFFTDPDKTWVVTVGADVAGTVIAENAEQAEKQIRDRHKLADDVRVSARTYEKRFGAEAGGAWWGQGPEMTALDPKITFDLIRNPDFASPRISSWEDVEEVRLDDADKYRLEVVYSRLYSPALSNLTGTVIPYHVWNPVAWKEEAIRKERGPADLGISEDDYNVIRALPAMERDFRHKPSVHGPFVLEPLNGDARPLWKSAEKVTLRRNEFYWARKPTYQFLDFLLFDPALGMETAEIAFLSGNMDLYTARAFQVERYAKMTDQYYVLERPTTTYEYLGFNCRKGPLANKRVRLALSMGIDVEKIIKYVAYDQAQRIAGPAYPVLPWNDTDYRREHTWLSGADKGKTEQLPFIPFNIEEAQAILKEEGYTLDSSGILVDDKGAQFRIRIVNGAGGLTRTDIALLARENWEKLGVRVEYEEYEWNVFISQYVKPGNFDVIVLGWSGGLSFDKRQLFHTQFTPPNGLNFAGLANPEIDGMMDRILQVYDPDQQIKLSHEIFAALAEECPYVFLYSPSQTSVMDRRIVWQRPATGNELQNLPVNHQHIAGAKQSLLFFVPELKRLDEAIPFTEEDRTR